MCPGVAGHRRANRPRPNRSLSSLGFVQWHQRGDSSGSLTLGSDGNFYGTTEYGGNPTDLIAGYDYGESSFGTVFMVTTNGVLTTLASFNCINGENPVAGLTLGKDGNFYGTAEYGGFPELNGGFYGVYSYGTIFRMSPSGALSSLVDFGTNGVNGGWPEDALTLGNDGNFYGTTWDGTVFRMTPGGAVTTLVIFNGTNGWLPFAGLTLGNDGNFYGTTWNGGINFINGYLDGDGTVFRMTPSGVLTTLVSFNNTNGAMPYAGLTLGNDGNFYGTTYYGGTYGSGTVFQMTTNGVLTTLVSFFSNGSIDDVQNNGFCPQAALTLGNDGNFYGTTYWGGTYGCGTVFRVTTNGVLNTLVSFNGTNGEGLVAGLTQGNDGNFYGTTEGGGIYGGGTVFSFTPPHFPDLVAVSLEWNTNEDEEGLDFAYSLQYLPLTNATEAALFWADGTNVANIISSTPIFEEPIPADFAFGATADWSVDTSYFADPPSGATTILLVVDPPEPGSGDDEKRQHSRRCF